jgi:uncharacterized DUF497 family protein
VLIEFDPAKNAKNVRERGLDFNRAQEFDFGTAETVRVLRGDEVRFVATGLLGTRLHVLCYKSIDNGIRVISFRKANKREAKRYEEGRRNLEQGT